MQMALGFAIAAQYQTNKSSINKLKEVGEVVQKCIGALEGPIKELGIKYAEKQEIFTSLGSGPFFGLAKYGGAKFLEFALPCYSQCLEECVVSQALSIFETILSSGEGRLTFS